MIIYNTLNIYLTFSFFYTLFTTIGFVIDYYGIFEHRKILHRTRKEYITLYKKCLPNVAKNIYMYSLPFFTIVSIVNSYCKNIKMDKFIDNYLENWPILNFLYKIIITSIATDILFYTTHKLFHTKILYKYHKIHHEIKHPITIATLYMHPVDLIFSNLMPLSLCNIFLQINCSMLQLIIIFQLFISIFTSHGGYKRISFRHEIHHSLFKYNYGTSETGMDYFFETLYKVPGKMNKDTNPDVVDIKFIDETESDLSIDQKKKLL